jgi:hypothetical protein
MAKRVDARGCVVKLLPPKKRETLTRKKKPPASSIPLSFLLGCTESELGSFELVKLSIVANLRSELHGILDQVIDHMTQAALAAWFRTTDRETLKQALENPEDVIAWAKERIKNGQRGEQELLPRALLPSGSAHIAASLRYQERNIAAGKCAVCPEPLDRNSVRFCTFHLEQARERAREKAKKLNKPPRGRHPATIAALAKAREKQAKKKGLQ